MALYEEYYIRITCNDAFFPRGGPAGSDRSFGSRAPLGRNDLLILSRDPRHGPKGLNPKFLLMNQEIVEL
jgi:hypothetical protein